MRKLNFSTSVRNFFQLNLAESEKVKVCGKNVVFVVPENAFSLRPEILIVYYCDDNCWYNFLITIVIHHLPQLFRMYEKIVREHFAEPFFAFKRANQFSLVTPISLIYLANSQLNMC